MLKNLGLLLALGSALLRADIIALDPGSRDPNLISFDPHVLGWEFTISQTITVTQLGVFDADGDGLMASHAVGLWSSTGNLLTSSTIPAGTVAGLMDGFRYESIASIVLNPGTYVIGAFYDQGNDELVAFASNFATASPVTFVKNRTTSTQISGLVFPPDTFRVQDPGYFGPNFQFTTPEPSALLLCGAGLLALANLLRGRGGVR